MRFFSPRVSSYHRSGHSPCMVDINWLGVVAGTIGYQVLGALWFGPVFGKLWMDALGYDS